MDTSNPFVYHSDERGEGFMRKLLLLVAALVGTLAIAVVPGSAVTGNFVKDFEHPYVGLVAFYDEEGEFMWRCSGITSYRSRLSDCWALHRPGRRGVARDGADLV